MRVKHFEQVLGREEIKHSYLKHPYFEGVGEIVNAFDLAFKVGQEGCA